MLAATLRPRFYDQTNQFSKRELALFVMYRDHSGTIGILWETEAAFHLFIAMYTQRWTRRLWRLLGADDQPQTTYRDTPFTTLWSIAQLEEPRPLHFQGYVCCTEDGLVPCLPEAWLEYDPHWEYST
jgi:hypothetical protein